MAFTLGNENLVKIFIRLQQDRYAMVTYMSTAMFGVEVEILSLEPGGAVYRLRLPKRKYSKHINTLKLFNFKLGYLFCQNILAKGGSGKIYRLEIRQIKIQVSVHSYFLCDFEFSKPQFLDF